ncbi:MAG: hypothetical protein HY680_11680 [Chloroflexi bacterium]|nr:hypothetical protein [Chloroflexota bacterium]
MRFARTLKWKIGLVVVLLALGIFSVASFAATTGSGSLTVTVGGTSGNLGAVTAVSTSGSIGYVTSGTESGSTVSTATSITLTAAVSTLRVGDTIQWGSSSTTQRGYITAIAGAVLTVADTDGTGNDAPADAATVYKVLKNGSAPTWTPVLNSPSPITAGDIFLVDVADYTGNVLITLYLTNPDQLAIDYSYLNQSVNVYALCRASGGCAKGSAPFAGSGTADQGTWVQATNAAGTDAGTTGIAATAQYLTLTSGYVNLILKGGYEYAVTVDSGSGYTIASATTCTSGNGCLSPAYLLDLNPA